MKQGRKCAVVHCQRGAVRDGLCPVCCMTWLCSEASDYTRGRAERLVAFVKRQETRHMLRALPPDTRPACRNGHEAKALESGACSSCEVVF